MLIELLFIIAFILIVTEAFVAATGILGFAGFAAYIAGVWMLIASGADSFYGLSVTNVIILGIVFFAAFGILLYYLYSLRKKKVETGIDYLIGKTAEVTQWDNHKGKVFIDGEDWRAQGPVDLEIGDIVEVKNYAKLTLFVEKED